ncbi:unnamed protein product [Soboliphyme baturini]|uniref:Transposase n=1 Tax=Soboliphyme baturini TaxID=241478 RepID=A0A183J215_9BILA|nr:unnamed protein product [Soboliphyme baturini]
MLTLREAQNYQLITILLLERYCVKMEYQTKIWLSHQPEDHMGCLRRIAGLMRLDRVRSSVIRESYRVQPLLLQNEKSELRWFGRVFRMPIERKVKKVLLAPVIG